MSLPAQNATQQDALEQSENINSGATDDNGADEQQSMNPRMSAMERIAEQRRSALAADGVDVSGMDTTTPTIDEDEGRDDNSQLAAQLVQDDRPTHYASADTLVKVKVDGEEQELPLSEVIKSYQKDSAASKRLQEATRLLQIAEQQANNIAKQPHQENNSDNANEPDPDKKEGRLASIKGAFSKLYEGDEEGAAEEMLRLLDQGANTATQPRIDPAQIAAQVRQQLAVESAYGQVQSDYPELFSDTERGIVLGKETFARLNAKEAQGIPRSLALQESAEEVAALFGIQKGRQQTAPARTARDTKLERKANLDIPESANVVAGNKQSHAEAPNVSSVIKEMAAARLGQSMKAG